MKGFVKLLSVVLVATVFAISCSKDKPSGSLAFSTPAVFLQPGEEITVGFVPSANIAPASYTISDAPDGWDQPVINAEARTITFKAPEEFDSEVVKTGSIILTCAPAGGVIASASLFVAVVDVIDFAQTQKASNSYLVSRLDTRYLFDALHKPDGSAVAAASVGVIWQSMSGLLQYVTLDKNKVSFYIGSNDDGELKEGNAVIGAYDTAGTLIWSWHIWVSNYDPEKDMLAYAGYTVMNRNLGALNNKNTTEEEILASYGLYYQWGRKDPFIGPSSYSAGSGSSASMYNGSNSRVYLKTAASSAETGTMDYAVKNPLTFITGSKESAYDWLWTSHSNDLWSGTKKTANDPCPSGWRIAPVNTFDGLTIADDISSQDLYTKYYNVYGWTLEKNSVKDLYIGAGMRRYDNGSIYNIFDPETLPVRNAAMEMQPWIGYYWTAGTQADTKSSALYFWFYKADVPKSSVAQSAVAQYRANGMQVRCVKEVE